MAHPERMIWWTLCAWFCCTSARPASGVDDFAFCHENVMGTSLELRVLAGDRESLRTGTVHDALASGGRAAVGRRGTANRNGRGPACAGRGCIVEP
jgi:hypothetical protein